MYTPVIGLEIHAELKTRTKMFCRSLNATEAAPNTNICPVCMAHPGTLPVINREAVRHVLKVGLAVGGNLADYTEFDRKNYFYPDLPKGYQLSQYEYPLVSGGVLNGVQLTRIHLEEDTARSAHDEAAGTTVIDYNRAGVPLMELVTEPVIHSAQEAGDFARELRLLLRTLGVAEANMEKGEMRVEANISVGQDGNLGTKVEVKNLNSFRSMERAIAYEIDRQTKLLEQGEVVIQETRGWDEGKQATYPQRIKEGSADYRYFPDPDLPSLKLSEIPEFSHDALRAELPPLPSERREAYKAWGLQKDDVELYVRDRTLGVFYDTVAALVSDDAEAPRTASNYIATDLVKRIRDMQGRDAEESEISQVPVSAEHFAMLIRMVRKNEVSSRAAKDLLGMMIEQGESPEILAEKHGLKQSSSEADLLPIIDGILKEHGGVVADYRAGKEAALQFLVGQGMKATKGAADPQALRALIIATINKA